ncbi:MAG: tetratricopeptide repeat protein [Planctomycetota bacterium]
MARLLAVAFLLPVLASVASAFGVQDPAADEKLWREAGTLFGRGLYWQAEPRFRELVRRRPRDAKVHFGLGAVLMRTDRSVGALAAFDASLALDDRDAQTHHLRARVLEALERPDEAATAFARSLELAPRDPEVLLRAGILAARRGRAAEARDLLDRCLALGPDRVEALYERAQLDFRAGEDEAARRGAERAAALDAAHAPSRYLLSRLAAKARRRDEAARWAREYQSLQRAAEAADRARLLAAGRVALGYGALNAGRLREALDYLLAALEASPGEVQARAGLDEIERRARAAKDEALLAELARRRPAEGK